MFEVAMRILSYGRAGIAFATGNSCCLLALFASPLLCPRALAKPITGGISYYNAEDYKKAMPIFERVLARDPNNEQARY